MSALDEDLSTEFRKTAPNRQRSICAQPNVGQRGPEGRILSRSPIHLRQNTKTVARVRDKILQRPRPDPAEQLRIATGDLGQHDQSVYYTLNGIDAGD